MPYIVLVGGCVAIVSIWLKYAQNKHDRDARTWLVWSVIGTAAIGWAMWAWGVQALQEQAVQSSKEQQWLDTFVAQHHQEWDAECRAILTSLGAQGVIYDPSTGAAYTIGYCESMWSPPEQPTVYSNSRYEQPGAVAPFPSAVLFGDPPIGPRCVDPQLQECYDWIVFRGGAG